SAANGGAITAYSAVNTVTPVAASAGSTGNSTAITVPSVTPTGINNMLVAVVGMEGAVTPTFTTGAAYVDRSSFVASGIAIVEAGDVQTHVQNTSGASGTKTVNTGLLVGQVWSAQ